MNSTIANGDDMDSRIRLQPLLDMNTEEIIGYEALYSRKSESCPFPSAASILSSIASVSDSEAMQMSDANYHFNDKNFKYFINMTNEDAVNPRFVTKFLKTFQKTKLNPDQVVLEVSENTAVNKMECTKKILGAFCSSGIHIALDDFGTNFSTLDFLSQFPLDVVKIDKVFVQEAPYSRAASDLLKFSVKVSHDIGYSVVAEGIENKEHMDCAMDAGADIGQGFMFTPSSYVEPNETDLIYKNGINNPFIPLGDFRQYVSAIATTHLLQQKSVA